MSDNVREVTGEEFDTVVLKAAKPVLIDFWAPWCGPCRMVGPEFEKLAGSHAGSCEFMKLNVDEAGDIAARYGVMSIPTIAKFEAGQMVAQVVGARSADQLAREFGL